MNKLIYITKKHLSNHLIDTNDVLVTDAKLVLVECNRYEALLRKAHGEGQYWILLNSNGWLNDDDKFYKPILISETEKIEVGDWMLSHNRIICQAANNILVNMKSVDGARCYKVLSLPEHFSPQQLQMIVEGKLKDGDKMLVECESKDKYSEPYLKGLKEYQIKLNPHITIYPPVEEKMYTKKEIANYIQQFSEAAMTHGSSFNGRLFLTNWDQWFEQNVK